jgi:hypothetical protein
MITESLLNKGGVADGIGHRPKNSPQITVFSDLTEHLRETEGLDEPGRSARVENGSDKPVLTVVLPATKGSGDLGIGLGDRASRSDGSAVAQEVAAVRVLSDSTNSSM